ncbi:MAG: hypothetical protein M0030_26710 [Actinomycetota bacterium]|nr:hypothetical protein [Actinomycetota bacterium]
MNDEQRLICPGCGEDAVPEPPADLTPWQAHGQAVPEWSHRDRSSLCPVIGPAGYEPAQPQPVGAQAGTEVPRLVPPDADRQASQENPGRQAGTGGPVGRAYMTRAITRLGEMHRQDQAEPEPEAGS